MAVHDKYDVVIIGAGPAGYVGAIKAGQLGLKTCVIEKDKCGGICLNWGCIPSKNLIHQAQVFGSIQELKEMGIKFNLDSFNYASVHKKSRKVVERLNRGIEFLLKKNKIELIKGKASISGKSKVSISDGRVLDTKTIIVATGSRPAEVPGFEFDHKQVLSSNDILSLQQLPESLVILGAGAIGCEFAYIMNTFGVKVTLVEMADHVLPFEDAEIAAILEKSFQKSSIDVLTGHKAVTLTKSDDGVDVTLEDPEGGRRTIKAQKSLCVFGRKPNTENIGLENVGLKTDNGYLPVSDFYQTAVDSVFAVGDVVATPLLAHVASKEAEIAVEYIAGQHPEPRIEIEAIPSAIYCEPQVASFGLTEDKAKQADIAYQKAVFPLSAIGKAVAIGKPDGIVKVLVSPDSHEIIGCHIIGHDATELIHEALLAKSSELLTDDIACMVHAHPTLSESIMEAMRAVEGMAIHY